MSFGHFTGEVAAKWLQHSGDDRKMRLLEDFTYIDPEGNEWRAAKGNIINGASIPSSLWSAVGPPFVGDYRRASVVHDVACDERTSAHEDVHLMFYNAMRADGVSWTKANVMYQAVKRFGPKWGTTGSVRRSRKAPDDEVLKFAQAVEIASAKIKESEGLDAVERLADDILVDKLSNDSLLDSNTAPRGNADTKRSKTVGVSKVRPSNRKKVAKTGASTTSEVLVGADPAIRRQLSGSLLLSQFRQTEMDSLDPLVRSFVSVQSVKETADPTLTADLLGESEDGLTSADRLRLVDQALVLLSENYVHLPLKESLYAINPVQKLRLLREELSGNLADGGFDGDLGFHRRLLEVFLSTRDLHTNYILPSPFREKTVFVPFLVEDYFDSEDAPNQRRFLVTKVAGGVSDSSFAVGVEITRWNGVNIERAVEINGERFAGSNREASRARGIETLTVRPLLRSLPPEEDFVLVEYRDSNGDLRETRFDWVVFSPDIGNMAALQQLDELTATAQGIDLEQAIVRWVKKILFAPEAVALSAKMARRHQPKRGQGLQSLLPDTLEAKALDIDSSHYGYVRIRSFSVSDADQFVREFIRLAELLPQDGLIIDVRGNGGGLIPAGEQLLQILTPHPVEPTLFQMLVTRLNRQLVESLGFLAPWRNSMRQAVQTGASYSQGFPITQPDKANEIGQRYYGPVVLITDALCYSTTDIFAAGFQDHGIGTIIGIDNNTGAGGANVWSHDLLADFLDGDPLTPYLKLPSNSGMRVSIRRTIRVGESNGTVLEDFGVVPDILHPMTRDDLLEGNTDLLAKAADVLANQPSRLLRATLTEQDNSQSSLSIDSKGLDRIDIFSGTRPLGSIDVAEGTTEVTLEDSNFDALKLLGYNNDQLVASSLV